MLSEDTLSELRKIGARRILVQIPEGLKPKASEIVAGLERAGFDAILSVEPCFGACDIGDRDAEQLGCDALLHIGHTDFGIKPRVPVVYDSWESHFDPVKLLRRNAAKISVFRRMGVLTTAQHLGSLPGVRKYLEGEGKTVVTAGRGRLRRGQVLGCDAGPVKAMERKVDCFLFIGSGSFHPSAVLRAASKPVLFADVESGRLERLEGGRDKAEIKRQMRIEKARSLSVFAVFVSTKPGQENVRLSGKLKKRLSGKGKRAFIITAGMITREKILGMGIEVLVNTACPRISDDQGLLGVIVLSPEDVREL